MLSLEAESVVCIHIHILVSLLLLSISKVSPYHKLIKTWKRTFAGPFLKFFFSPKQFSCQSRTVKRKKKLPTLLTIRSEMFGEEFIAHCNKNVYHKNGGFPGNVHKAISYVYKVSMYQARRQLLLSGWCVCVYTVWWVSQLS